MRKDEYDSADARQKRFVVGTWAYSNLFPLVGRIISSSPSRHFKL